MTHYEKTKAKPRSRNWCFTDYQALDILFRLEKNETKIRYCCWGQEICPTTRKPHQQGWVQFENPQRMSTIKNMFMSQKFDTQ